MPTLEAIMCFESGTVGECGPLTTATIETTPAPPDADETYVAKLASGSGHFLYMPEFASGNDKYAVGFSFRITELNPAPNWYFFSWQTNKVNDFQLWLMDGGAIRIYDANEAIVATSATGVLTANAWYLIELLFERGDPGSLIIRVCPWGGTPVEVLNTSGEDYDGGGVGTHSPLFSAQGFGGNPCDIYVSGLYEYHSASTVADLKGNFASLTYRMAEDTATPDVSGHDDLDNGTKWIDAADDPFSDVDYAQYTGSGDIGVVTTSHSGGSNQPGPRGDSRIGSADVLLGMGWLYRYKITGSPASNKFYPHYGKTSYGSEDVDNTTKGAAATSSVPAYILVVSDNAADVPTKDEWCQCGFEVHGGPGVKNIICYDAVCHLLVQRVTAFRGVHLGAGPIGRAQGKEILVG